MKIRYVAACLMGLIGIAPAHADESAKLMVVCSTTQIADFARQVGGDQVVVRLSDVDPSRGRIIRRLAAGAETKR